MNFALAWARFYDSRNTHVWREKLFTLCSPMGGNPSVCMLDRHLGAQARVNLHTRTYHGVSLVGTLGLV